MDYEKEYKESFEAAKGLHDAGNALTKKQMEIVFHQLAESEDERIRKFLIDYFTSYKIGNVATKLNGYRIDDILAYLEKQKEQKPAEWSEEDEMYLSQAIETLEHENYSILADKLKSLRNRVGKEFLQPHWKPSEKQIKALLHAVDKARTLYFTSIDGYPGYNDLRSLYEQLKKLM